MPRSQGDSSAEADIPRNVRSRHVLGLIQRPGGYVFCEIPPKAGWILGCSPELQAGYRGLDAGYKSAEEGMIFCVDMVEDPLTEGQDLTSTSAITMSLPIITLPHVITPSLALSVLSDLLPRLTHSQPAIRKKTIVTLYRLALVYPETLRPAWPKIKERLMDEGEDPSVTAAIVNVVCELGWRRPNDFLPLAPRLFELLVDSGNNWMAIKLIKLVSH